jgi:hypothetical protein
VIQTEKTVGDLNCPNHTVTIAANELRGGEERNVRFLYKAADMRFMTVTTVSSLNKPVDGTIEFDGHEVGVGEATVEYDPSVVHHISFGDIDYLVTPEDVVMELEQYADGFVMEVLYDLAENAAEVCFYPRNAETGEVINAVIQVNAMELREGEYCRLLSTTTVIRATAEHRPEFYTPYEFKIPPNVLDPGLSYEYDLVYETDVMQLCVDTTPVLGEVFIVDIYGMQRSIGWPLDDEYACARVNPDTMQSVTFGDVEGHETPPPDEDLSTNDWGFETVIGFYDSSQLALVCVYTTYENESWWMNVKEITLDEGTLNEQKLKIQYEQWSCLAVDPHVDHEIAWGDAYSENYVVPAPTPIPAGILVAGERSDYICGYAYRSNYPTIRLQILNDFGHSQSASFTVDGYSRTDHQYESSWSLHDYEEVVFEFQPVPYLITPAPLAIDLTALSMNDPNYNSGEDLWEFEEVYSSAEPSAWVCVEAINHDGVLVETTVRFNGLDSASSWEDRLHKCRVLPVGDDHIITHYGQPGYASSGPLFIPGGRLTADTEASYTIELVLENRFASVCIGTSGAQGEIFLNGRSLGWPAVLDVCQVQFVLDITRLNTISFSNEPGFTTPADIIFSPNDLAFQGYQEFIGVYQ